MVLKQDKICIYPQHKFRSVKDTRPGPNFGQPSRFCKNYWYIKTIQE